jgi:hypothetical protein
MGVSYTDNNALRDAMDLLLRLTARDSSEIGRVILTDEQRPRANTLLDGYFGDRRDELSRSTLAIPSDTRGLRLRLLRLFTEIQERNTTIRFLDPDETSTLGRSLKDLRRETPRFTFRWPDLRRRTWIITAASLVAAAVLAPVGLKIIGSGTSPTSQPPTVTQPLPPANNQPLTQTDLQQALNLFGPWQTIAPSEQQPDSHQPALLVLNQNGGTIASQHWTVPFSTDKWEQQASTNIAKLSVEGTHVRITSTLDQPYIVHVGQPFMFERTPGQIYLVDQAGNIWYIDLAGATAIRQQRLRNDEPIAVTLGSQAEVTLR